MRLRLYCIWHNKLFDELYTNVAPEDFENLVMFGVNEKYPKLFNSSRGYNVQYEYDLPLYVQSLQQHGYCQTTAMYHIYKNGLHRDLDYIGFLQYDMQVADDCFSDIQQTVQQAASAGKEVIFHDLTHPLSTIAELCSQIVAPYEGSVLQHYNRFFGTEYSPEQLLSSPSTEIAPLLHTFVMPVPMFEKMMGWVCCFIDELERSYPKYPYECYQGGLSERCHALFLAIEAMERPTYSTAA